MQKLDLDIAHAPEFYEHLGWASVLVALLLIAADLLATVLAQVVGAPSGGVPAFVRIVLPESVAGFVVTSLMLVAGAAVVWRARWWRAARGHR